MKILLIEPFFGGSHQQWAKGLQKHSRHCIELLTLSGHYWKWRMHGAAVTLAQRFLDSSFVPDLILASDMLDLNTFLALTRHKTKQTPALVYFHENQLTYPWSPSDQDPKRGYDNHYKFLNYTTALAADYCLFNSQYNQNSFLDALPDFLKQFPDHQNLATVQQIRQKSHVLPLGLDLTRFDSFASSLMPNTTPCILWNHRWEYDKNPKQFFHILYQLQEQGIDFRLIVLGQAWSKQPPIFAEAKQRLQSKILHWGYCPNPKTYAQWLYQADILPITSHQDFFGGSLIEAVYCQTLPLMPRRLAYPEHFPNHPTFYYDNEQDLLNRLTQLLQSPIKKDFRNLVQHYDWDFCIKEYDRLFDRFTK